MPSVKSVMLHFRVYAGQMLCGTLRVSCYPNGNKYHLYCPMNAPAFHGSDAIDKVTRYRKLRLQRIDTLAAWQ